VEPNATVSDFCTISGKVEITDKFDGGNVRLTENYVNTARMPETRTVSEIQLDSKGYFTFTNLKPGDYVVEPVYYNKTNGPITYNPGANPPYYYFVIYKTHSWSRKVILSSGREVKLKFLAKDAKIDSSNQYVYSQNYLETTPYNPFNPGAYTPPEYDYTPYTPYNTPAGNYTPYTTPATNYTPYTAPVTNYTPYTQPSDAPYTPYNTPPTTYTPYNTPATLYSPYNYLNK